MLAKFKSKKQSILDSLHRPSADYEDLSPKGNLDDEIRELVGEINSLQEFVTTSSCAGRVAVYLEGEAKSSATGALENEQDASVGTPNGTTSSTGGKGRGRWLFISHEAVDLSQLPSSGSLLAKLGLPRNSEVSFPSSSEGVRFVRLKFEPMILHVLASSAESAQTMLGAGMAAGFRESGISGVVDSKGRPSVPMVAIRSGGMAMDCIIGFMASSSGNTSARGVQPMVTEEYLRTVLEVANQRFRQNLQRKERFRESLLMQYAGCMNVPDSRRRDYRRKGGYQTASERKAEKRAEDMRKREEALERRAQALHRGGALDGAIEHDDNEGSGDEIGLGGLMSAEGEQDGEDRG